MQQEMLERLIKEFAVKPRGSVVGETGGVRDPVKLPTKGATAYKRKVKGGATATSKRKKKR